MTRLAAMRAIQRLVRASRPAHVALILLAAGTLLAGCAATAGPSSSGPSGPPPVTASPSASLDASTPIGSDLPPAASDPPAGEPDTRIVVPKPGQLDVRAIPAETLEATVNGRRAIITVTFTSGVEPCHVLDSIVVERGDHAFAITLREGRGPGDNVCIEIAETKRTQIDLGELEPGTYTISDAVGGGAAPITVTIG